MIQEIKYKNIILAIIVRNNFIKDGLKFVTNKEDFLQVGFMAYEKGHKILAHNHNTIERKIDLTQEALFIKAGKVLVSIFSLDKIFYEKYELDSGDLVIFLAGGHGLDFLEKSEIIEFKNGPYLGERDKTRIEK